jgi:hypothetical protein
MPLTDTKSRNAKGQIKSRKLSDGGGLHLLITPDGGKYWRLAYRWHGKQRTLALGVYPAVGLIEARASRDDAKRSITANIDPSDQFAKAVFPSNRDCLDQREWPAQLGRGLSPKSCFAQQVVAFLLRALAPAELHHHGEF